MNSFVYPATLGPEEDGGFGVTFEDFPAAITQAENLEEALKEASDCLQEAIANRIVMGLSIPKPSRVKRGQHAVSLSGQMSAKAALYTSMHALKMSKAELARHLNCDEREVGRLLNPRHQSQLHKIESALSILGKKLVVGYITNPQKPIYQSAPHV